jgi:hypothetical protein
MFNRMHKEASVELKKRREDKMFIMCALLEERVTIRITFRWSFAILDKLVEDEIPMMGQ